MNDKLVEADWVSDVKTRHSEVHISTEDVPTDLRLRYAVAASSF